MNKVALILLMIFIPLAPRPADAQYQSGPSGSFSQWEIFSGSCKEKTGPGRDACWGYVFGFIDTLKALEISQGKPGCMSDSDRMKVAEKSITVINSHLSREPLPEMYVVSVVYRAAGCT